MGGSDVLPKREVIAPLDGVTEAWGRGEADCDAPRVAERRIDDRERVGGAGRGEGERLGRNGAVREPALRFIRALREEN